MRQFQVTVVKGIDGYEASVPSIKECAAWAETEQEALERMMERLAFFLSLPPGFKHEFDRSRSERNTVFYTLIIRS
ncbi:MAG: type II toxin-antitoxin system HicB family antitoxin [Chlorobi bacterium]|nr:type II toxin-antitoxin system HicB family antitoxin [Chlorobiota bacterium]